MPDSPASCSVPSGASSQRYTVFSSKPVTPDAAERFERRFETLFRELARRIVEWTLARIESPESADVAVSFEWAGETYRRNRRTSKTIDTRFGSVAIERWFYQNTETGSRGLAPLDVCLGLFGDRMTPALAEVTGRLAADMPQQAALDMLAERFAVRPGVAAYRRIVSDIATAVRAEQDEVAIETLCRWIEKARKSEGKRDVLLQVGRDGVLVQTRPCWEEASCGTLSVYDRGGRRLGTVYLGQMPESEQPTMTSRLTAVITGIFK